MGMERSSRNHIIQYLSTAALSLFQEDAPVELYTDASSLGCGAVLIQITGDRHNTIAYMSQRMTDTEICYHSFELETLAALWSEIQIHYGL